MPDAVKAPLVLTLICAFVCGALAFANDLTADTIAAAEEERLQQSLTEAFGESDYTPLEQNFEGINQVITDAAGRIIFDVTSTGYEKDGQHLLIGLDSGGSVSGVCIVSIEDSPTQADKVQQDAFLSQFIGRNTPGSEYDAVSGATKSSSGIRNAVDLALRTYIEHEEAIKNGK